MDVGSSLVCFCLVVIGMPIAIIVTYFVGYIVNALLIRRKRYRIDYGSGKERVLIYMSVCDIVDNNMTMSIQFDDFLWKIDHVAQMIVEFGLVENYRPRWPLQVYADEFVDNLEMARKIQKLDRNGEISYNFFIDVMKRIEESNREILNKLSDIYNALFKYSNFLKYKDLTFDEYLRSHEPVARTINKI